jgi:type II secretory pathway component PulF
MPVFDYKAVTETGATIEDTMEAPNQAAVADKLQKLGYTPLRITPQRQGALQVDLFGGKKVKLDEVIVFTRQLVTLLRAGVPLLSCLEALVEQIDSEGMQEVISEIYVDIESGKSFSEALSRHPKVFSELYVNSIRAGEAGGALDDILMRLATLMEHEKETRTRIKKAMRYPIIVVISLVIAFLVLMMLVVPKFVEMFIQVGVELPLPTRMLIGLHAILQSYWYILLGVLIVAGVALKKYIATEQGRYKWDKLMLSLPVLGNLTLKNAMSRFAKMFETLNSSGLPILQTLEIVAKTVGNVVVGTEIEKATLGIRKGEGLSTPLKQSSLFPPMVVRMIAIGEQSGALDEMLKNISQHYDMEVENAVDGLTSMIEPMLTVVLGVVVLFMALAIFLPMWNLTQIAGQ